MKNYQAELVRLLLKKEFENAETCLPGVVESYDADTQRAKVKIQIDRGNGPELLVNVRVKQTGGDWCVVTQIDKGTEGDIHFYSRAVARWIESGDFSEPDTARRFSIRDASFYPGSRSNPNDISNKDNDGVRLQNKDGSVYAWLKSNGEFHTSGKIFSNGEEVTTVKHTHVYIDSQGTAATPVQSETEEAKPS